MTEETHGRGGKREQKQRGDRRTERIQLTHLRTKRIVSITQKKRMRLLLMSTDESLWIRSVGVNQSDWKRACGLGACSASGPTCPTDRAVSVPLPTHLLLVKFNHFGAESSDNSFHFQILTLAGYHA